MPGSGLFLAEFLRRPGEVASLVPSSPWLKQRIVRAAGIREAQVIVELGPGTGGTTRAILAAMNPDARLITVEVNARFHDRLRRITDTRHMAYRGSATELADALAEGGLAQADVVVSGIPFSKLPEQDGSAIIQAVHDCLRPGGRFVAYQLSERVARLAEPVFGTGQRESELFNVPPLRVFRWERAAA